MTVKAPLLLAERNPLKTDPAQRLRMPRVHATKLGRDPDMRRNVPTDLLLAPHPSVREKKLGRRRPACHKKRALCRYTRYICIRVHIL